MEVTPFHGVQSSENQKVPQYKAAHSSWISLPGAFSQLRCIQIKVPSGAPTHTPDK